MLGFGPDAPQGCLNLSPTGDLEEASRNLYAYLVKLSLQKPDGIAVSPIPMTGVGIALNDRLKKASAFIKDEQR